MGHSAQVFSTSCDLCLPASHEVQNTRAESRTDPVSHSVHSLALYSIPVTVLIGHAAHSVAPTAQRGQGCGLHEDGSKIESRGA